MIPCLSDTAGLRQSIGINYDINPVFFLNCPNVLFPAVMKAATVWDKRCGVNILAYE